MGFWRTSNEAKLVKKIIIVPLNLIVKSNPQKTIDAFAKLGVSKFRLLWNWLPLPSFLKRFQQTHLPTVFDAYRKGRLKTPAFRKTVDLFKKGISLKDFDDAWNAQCELPKDAIEMFNSLNRLVKLGHEVYLLSGTNPLHLSYIERQYKKPLPGIKFLSYQRHKLGDELIHDLLFTLQSLHPDTNAQDRLWLYSKPNLPYPQLGWLRWLIAPFQSWFYQQATKAVATLQAHTEFTLLEQKVFQDPDWMNSLKEGLSPNFTSSRQHKTTMLQARDTHLAKTPSLKQQARRKALPESTVLAPTATKPKYL